MVTDLEAADAQRRAANEAAAASRASDADEARRAAFSATDEVARTAKAADPASDELALLRGLLVGPAAFADAAARMSPESRRGVRAILQAVVRNPEREEYRTLRLSNAAFRGLVASDEGVPRHALYAAGFAPRVVDADDAAKATVAYVLREPDLERDLDAWTAWYDALKASLAALE